MGRISGKDFDISIGGIDIHVESASLSIEDSSGVGKTRGIPNGRVSGEVSASGEMVLDAANVALLTEIASKAGAWQLIEVFDMLFYGKASGGEEMKVEAFGCALKASEVINITSTGGEKHTSTFPFDITSPDFVWINGVPYLDQDDVAEIVA